MILVCGLTLWAGTIPVAAATPSPRAQVVPSKVAIRGKATVIASNLQPHATVTLLFAVPNLRSHRVERLLGITHADAHGSIRVTVSIPLVTTCGAASMYVVSALTPNNLRAGFTLTGCKAGAKRTAPPPPPHKP
jgi:hypothetical protein